MTAPDYATHAQQGHMGDWRRGAPLGRPTLLPEKGTEAAVRLARVPIDAGGYDPEGTYFGLGDPLWWAATDDGSLDATFRAADETAASAHARTLLPGAAVRLDGTVGGPGRAADLAADPAFASYLAAMLRDAQLDEDEAARTEGREARPVGGGDDLPDDAYDAILADWRRFAEENAAHVATACALVPGGKGFRYADRPMTPERIGATVWLVRTGSGVAFTDDGDAECLQRLDAAAEALESVDPYLDDDGTLRLR